jgi:hypothetical protein
MKRKGLNIVQVLEHLSSKHKALSSKPNTPTPQKKNQPDFNNILLVTFTFLLDYCFGFKRANYTIADLIC